MRKKIIIYTGIVAIIISVLVNGYFLGWKRMEQRTYQRGVNNTVILIGNQVKNTGQISLPSFVFDEKEEQWIQNGQIILVPLGSMIGEATEEIEDK